MASICRRREIEQMKRQDSSQNTGAKLTGIVGGIRGRGSNNGLRRHAYSHKRICEPGIPCRIRGYLLKPKEGLSVSNAYWLAVNIGKKLYSINGIGQTVHGAFDNGIPTTHF